MSSQFKHYAIAPCLDKIRNTGSCLRMLKTTPKPCWLLNYFLLYYAWFRHSFLPNTFITQLSVELHSLADLRKALACPPYLHRSVLYQNIANGSIGCAFQDKHIQMNRQGASSWGVAPPKHSPMEIMESAFTASTVPVQTNLRKYRENIEKAMGELCPSKRFLGVLENWTLMPSIRGKPGQLA